MTVRAEIRPKMKTHWAFLLWLMVGYVFGAVVANDVLPLWATLLGGVVLGAACKEHAHRRDR